MLFDGSEEDPRAPGLGVIPGTIRWIPTGVKRPQMQWNQLHRCEQPDDPMFDGLGDAPRGCTSCTRCTACPTTRPMSSPRATTAAPSTPRSVRQRVRHAVPPGEVGRDGLAPARQLRARGRVPRGCTVDDGDGPVPGDRPARRAGRAPAQGDYADETVYGDDPVAVGDVVRRRRARRGCTSSTSTRRAPAIAGQPAGGRGDRRRASPGGPGADRRRRAHASPTRGARPTPAWRAS